VHIKVTLLMNWSASFSIELIVGILHSNLPNYCIAHCGTTFLFSLLNPTRKLVKKLHSTIILQDVVGTKNGKYWNPVCFGKYITWAKIFGPTQKAYL